MTAELDAQVALVNVSPDSNRGSCALTWASLDLVFKAFPRASVAIVPTAVTPPEVAPFRHTLRRHPNVKILPPLFDGEGKPAPALVARLGRSLLEILRFRRAESNRNATLEWLRHCDLVVSVGGITFETCGGTLRDDARFLVRMLPLLAARKIAVPRVLVGAQIGPFKTPWGGSLFATGVTGAAAVFPRDRVSTSEVQKHAARVRSVPMPDSVFAMERSGEGTQARFDGDRLAEHVATLALVVSRALRPNEPAEAHVTLFVEVARRLVESGLVAQVVVVIQCDEDRTISLELARRLQLDPRFVIDADLDPDQLSSFYGSCRMVVSSRLHAVLLALLAGVPAVSVAPEVTFKERAVLETLGLESLCISTTTTAPDRAAALCLDVAREEARYRQAVAVAVSAARARLEEVPQILREVVAAGRTI